MNLASNHSLEKKVRIFIITLSLPERCDFTSSQHYNNYRLLWYISRIEPYYKTPLLTHKYDKLEEVRELFQVSHRLNDITQQVILCL